MNFTVKKRPARSQGGFSLIEVIVSSAILMVVFVGLIGALTFSRRMQSLTENRLVCMHLAREYMEPFSRYMYDDDVFNTGNYSIHDDDTQARRGTCCISKVSGESSKDIEITIDWLEPSGKPYSITLKSSFSRSLHR